jgi:hypothetical protein
VPPSRRRAQTVQADGEQTSSTRSAAQLVARRAVRAGCAVGAVHAPVKSSQRVPELGGGARRYLSGLVEGLDHASGWSLAEQAGDHLAGRHAATAAVADWDVEVVRDDVRDYVVEHFHDRLAVLIVDDTGFLKKGIKSAAWLGCIRAAPGGSKLPGRRVLAYRFSKGHALIDRQLYLPQAWTDDRDRCRAAGGSG